MKIPSLRRPVGASVLAGICGAGLIDAALTAGHGGAGGVLALTLGFYGTAAIVGGLAAELVAEAIAGARPAGVGCGTSPITIGQWRPESWLRWQPYWWSRSWRRSAKKCSSARWPARSWRPSPQRGWWRSARYRELRWQ